MTISLVLTVIGHDRPGLVSAISEQVAAAGGSWLESRMARLAGEFAGIVLISVPEQNTASLTAALQGLESAGLRITAARASAARTGGGYRSLNLDLVGHDRPGIVRDVTQALVKLGVNIEEFSSFIASAPFTGEAMFHAAALLGVPDSVASGDLRIILERLADEIMVDLTTSEGDAN